MAATGSIGEESNKFCEACEAKMVIIFLSPSSPYHEEDIHCDDPKCLNCDSFKEVRSHCSLDELDEAQLVILACLHLHGTKEMEKLKNILEIPAARMTEEQRLYAKQEIGKLIEKMDKYMKGNPETSGSSSNNINI